MATDSGARHSPEPGSGGKIVRPRRALLRKTPYDRPTMLNSSLQNPSWISRHIVSPTRTIVSSATRILSSVLGFESSSSCSSSDCNSTSVDMDDSNEDRSSIHTIEHREPQSFAGKIETKQLIEQLLMQETFSWEECDKLTNILKSRIFDSPMIRGIGLGRLNEMPNKTGGSDVEIHDHCTAAVMEERKFLEEKKSDLHHGTSGLNSVVLTHGIEDEAGSPVGMAKSYMRTCSPWASPSTKNIEFRSPSSIGIPLFKKETPYSVGGKSLSSSKRRNSPATGSWNIQEEIRKVRSKATEEMLKNLSSSKIDWSSFSLEHKNGPDSLVAKGLRPAEEDTQSSRKSVDASVDLAVKPVSQITQDALHNDALPVPSTLCYEENRVMKAIENIEGKRDETLDTGQRLQSTVDAPHSDVAADVYHFKDSNESILPLRSSRDGTVQDSQVADRNCLILKEFAGIGGAASTANGFPSSGSCMSAELDTDQNHRKSSDEENAVSSGHDNAFRVAAENCELLSEASVEEPMVNETDEGASGSQHSCSMQHEGSPQHLNTPNSVSSMAGKSNSGIENEKQQEKKVSIYHRRGKGRGR
ncbi:hypothetical protein PTKIN_Ptkin03bG0169200 [Pterospermum kingtungense]